jgi:hypothetical protein
MEKKKKKPTKKPGMVTYMCGRLRQEDLEFEASLDCTMILCPQKTKHTKTELQSIDGNTQC